jgi:hypothetical protein
MMNTETPRFAASPVAFSEAYFARRDLGRLGLLALFYLTVCVFAPIFIGRAVLHRPLPHFAVIALFPLAWAGSLVWAARLRTVWRVERLIRRHASRSARVVDVAAMSRETRVPAACIEYVLGAMAIEGTVTKDGGRAETRVYRLVDDEAREGVDSAMVVPREPHAAQK